MAESLPAGSVVQADGIEVPLRTPWLAAFLGWLIPGAGHLYQGRTFKGYLFLVAVLGLYLLGMVIGNGRVVYASWKPEDRRWHYVCQLGVGLPSLPAAIQAWRSRPGRPPLWNGWMSRPSDMQMLDRWHKESSAGFDMGTLFTMVAGLLNYLAVFDAFGGPLGPSGKRDDATEGKAE
ncbi:MAG: DUF6677 family protein [Pirellulaceae bacterium]|jgi:hypothetical protein